MFSKLYKGALALMLLAFASAAPAQVVISQVYGGGGNTGAVLKNDYIELFNRGGAAVDLSGWSVQYENATGSTAWSATSLTGVLLQPGQYYLIKEAQGAGGTDDLPAPDATGTLALSGTAGRVALVNNTTLLTTGTCSGASVVDMVGYGSTATCFEGTGPAAAPANPTAVWRNNSGCQDTNNNAADFTVAFPGPRNSATPVHVCGLSIDSVSHFEGDSGTTDFVFTVSLSEPAPAGGVSFDIATADGTATQSDADYASKSLTSQTIAEGDSQYQFTVQVNGDTNIESDEQFSVDVTSISGVATTSAHGTGTIQNDDSPITLSIDNVSHSEGNTGTTDYTFTVSLSSPAKTGGVTFDIATADGTATVADSDYVSQALNAQVIAAGDSQYQFTVAVNGDGTPEPNETFKVNVSAISGTNVSTASAQGTGTIVNDDVATYSLMQIQGHGTASLLAGQSVRTTGNIVTALKSNGFFMQDPAGDGDLTTSDAVFVFTSAAPTVQVGDAVTVVASVQEFGGSTELTGATVGVDSSGNALPAAYALDANPPTSDPTTGICMGAGTTITNPPADADGYQASNFACLDGMLVAMQNGIVVGATFAQGQDGVHTGTPRQTWVKVNDGSPHPLRSVGALWPGLGAGIPVWNGEPEVVTLFYPGLPAFNSAGMALNDGTTFSLTGIMQGFQASGTASPIYEIYPAQLTPLVVKAADDELQPVADSASGTLTIGSQNLLHFFNASADGAADNSDYTDNCAGTGASDACPTPSEYATRLSKWASQICDVLKAPVVMDLEEIENLSVVRDLADEIFATCGTSYVSYLMTGNDVSGINIGLLVRSDVDVSSVTQIYKGAQTANCSGSPPCLLNDRPPVLMRASWNGYPFALLAIYDRSLSGLGDPTKPYIGPKRAEQAAQVASIVQAFQSGGTLVGAGNARQDAAGHITAGPFDIVGDASVPLLVAGDFNAYEFTDGYADVTGMIKGTADPSQNLYWYDGNAYDPTPAYVAPNPTLVDSGVRATPDQRYSYNFSGMHQEIDHVLLSRRAWTDFVSIGNAHGDADVSGGDAAILDPATPARSGDHDGQVVTIAIDRIFADGSEPQP